MKESQEVSEGNYNENAGAVQITSAAIGEVQGGVRSQSVDSGQVNYEAESRECTGALA